MNLKTSLKTLKKKNYVFDRTHSINSFANTLLINCNVTLPAGKKNKGFPIAQNSTQS